MTEEPELPQELLDGARAFGDTALVVLSRFSGEGWDRSSVEYNGEFNRGRMRPACRNCLRNCIRMGIFT